LGRLAPANEKLFRAFGAGNDYYKCAMARSPSHDRYPTIPPRSDGPECDTTINKIKKIKKFNFFPFFKKEKKTPKRKL
jgi:hypothetical protein